MITFFYLYLSLWCVYNMFLSGLKYHHMSSFLMCIHHPLSFSKEYDMTRHAVVVKQSTVGWCDAPTCHTVYLFNS